MTHNLKTHAEMCKMKSDNEKLFSSCQWYFNCMTEPLPFETDEQYKDRLRCVELYLSINYQTILNYHINPAQRLEPGDQWGYSKQTNEESDDYLQ